MLLLTKRRRIDLGFGGAETDGRDVFDHLVVLLTDEFPIDRPRENGP